MVILNILVLLKMLIFLSEPVTMARGAESVNVNNNKCASIEAWLKAKVMVESYCWKFIWRDKWKWLIWIIWTTHNKRSLRQLWCPNNTFWKYRKKRGFDYVKVPGNVSDELLKLQGLGFKGKMLVTEKAKTLPKAKNTNGVNQDICP